MKWAFAVGTCPEDCPGVVYTDNSKCTILHNSVILRRIVALENNAIHNVNTGDFGGWVETADNLSQFHEAWVGPCAKVYDDAKVSEQALVEEEAEVFDSARVFGNAHVAGGTMVGGTGWIDNDMNEGKLTNQNWVCCTPE